MAPLAEAKAIIAAAHEKFDSAYSAWMEVEYPSMTSPG
jgi:hypothetical protein